jgi:hypothetical protein
VYCILFVYNLIYLIIVRIIVRTANSDLIVGSGRNMLEGMGSGGVGLWAVLLISSGRAENIGEVVN